MPKPQISRLTGYNSEERRQERQNKNEKETEFDDLPYDGYRYQGNGQEQVKFFKEIITLKG